ncbi:MAG: efflux RND transporter periplasmic adaptor subunit [Planctomycetes bacterium]|nr:efflux RND transporter periplasmic adaptor subunit [Planctomycetota bacterium]
MKRFWSALSHAGWALFVFTSLTGVFLWRTGSLQLRLGATAPATTPADPHAGHDHGEAKEDRHDGCGGCEHDAKEEGHAGCSHEEGVDWCAEHNLPESQCVKCNPEAAAKLKPPPAAAEAAARAKCEHGVATIDCDNCRFEVGAVKVRPDVAKALLKTAKVEQREIVPTLRFTGSVQLDTSRVTDVTPPASGKLVEVNARLGQGVKKGDVLAIVHSAEFGEAKAAYLDAYTKVELAHKEQERQAAVGAALARLIERLAEWRQGDLKADPKTLQGAKEPLGEWKSKLLGAAARLRGARSVHEREKALVEKQVGTKAELEQAEQELHTAEVELAGLLEEAQLNLKLDGLRAETAVRQAEAAADAAEQRLHIFGSDHELCEGIRARKGNGEFAHLPVKAPMDGTVTAQHVTEGRYVKDETALFTLADLSNLWVWCSVYERDLAALQAGLADGKPLQATVRVAAFGDEPFCGAIDLVDSTVDEHTRTIRVRVQLDNTQGKLKAGMFASVEVKLPNNAKPAALVPRDAVLADEGKQFVFQEIKDGLWLRRDVVTGRTQDGLVEVVSGLEADATVAAGGAFMLKSDILRGKMGAG